MFQAPLPLLFKDDPPVARPAPTKPGRAATEVDELGFDLVLRRSAKRRSMEIIVRAGEVRLMLPQFVSTNEGMAFVQLKREWILKTLAKQANHQAEVTKREYKEGGLFSYLGREYPLRIYFGKTAGVQLINNILYVSISTRFQRADEKAKTGAIQKTLWAWYQEQALTILAEKVDVLCKKIKRPCKHVQLRRTKTKWGHCTHDGVLQFNWQIVCAPEAVIDYLVAHEVSHLVHHNHGVRFWRHVEKLYPEYKEHQAWLRRNEHRLTV